MDPLVWAAMASFLLVGLLVGWWIGREQPRERRTRPDQGPGAFPEGALQVLDSLTSTVIVLDAGNRVVHSTHHAADQGYVREGVVPHPAIRDLVEQVRSTGEVQDDDIEVTRSVLVGGRISVGCRVFPLGHDLVVILLEDRSRARRVEQVRRDFVANVSHELKTPVGGIALLAEAVQDARDEPEMVERFARRMVMEADRLSHLVQEIVEFSRLQAGESIEDPEPVNVVEVISTAVDHVRVHAEDRGVAVRQAGIAHGLTHQVFGDAELLTTAVRNLIVNAVNYSDRGTKVIVAVQPGEAEGTIRIVVTDQGIGIPTADLERIFERFYRVDAARSRHTGGTGLGLAIVKHIVANHGGAISVWSRPGTGSTFTIELPLVELPEEVPGGGDGAAGAPTASVR